MSMPERVNKKDSVTLFQDVDRQSNSAVSFNVNIIKGKTHNKHTFSQRPY